MLHREPRLIFVNRFFHPDHSSTAQILSEVAFDLAKDGRRVSVVTGRRRYEGGGELPKRETIKGVDVIRLATTDYGRRSLLRRTGDHMSFHVAALAGVMRLAARGDIVIAKTDPPLLSVSMALAARLRGARFVTWLQDLYPEVAGELGVALARGVPGRILRALRDRSLRRADVNVVIGERMAERLAAQGLAPSALRLVQNFAIDDAGEACPFRTSPLRAAWGFEAEDFVVAYSGNLGLAHDVDTLLKAAERLKRASRIKFLFVGGGALRDRISNQAALRDLSNIVLQPYQPRRNLTQSLGAADIHWLSLRPKLEGLIVPSKLYGAAAVGRPVLAIGDMDGEAGRLVRRHGFGCAVAIGDDAELAKLILRLSQSPEEVAAMGKAARRFSAQVWGRRRALAAWRGLAKDLVAAAAAGRLGQYSQASGGEHRDRRRPQGVVDSAMQGDDA